MTVTTKEFELTLDEFRQLIDAARAPLPLWRRWLPIILVVGGGFLIYRHFQDQRLIFLAGLYAFVYGLLLVPLRAYSHSRWVRKHYQASGAMPFSVILHDEGVEARSSIANIYTKWIAYTHYKESDTAFVLYQPALAASLIPKRAFVSPQDEQTARDLLREKIGRTAPAPVQGFDVVAGKST
jgi:hypothetical protein